MSGKKRKILSTFNFNKKQKIIKKTKIICVRKKRKRVCNNSKNFSNKKTKYFMTGFMPYIN